LNRCQIVDEIWSLKGQYDTWLEVEKAVAVAEAVEGVIPHGTGDRINLEATYDLTRCIELEEEMHHDLNAFVRCVAESLEDGLGAYVHYGLTSSDVVDTALSLRLTRTVDHFIKISAQKAAFGPYPWPRTQQLMIRAREEIGYGKISGPVGTHASVSPEVEEEALAILKLEPEPISTQVVPRDRHAAMVMALAGVSLAFGGRETVAVLCALENIVLWHERDISHSSNERIYLPQMMTNIDSLLHKAKGDW